MPDLKIKILYQHVKGKVFFAHGIAIDDDKNEVMLITDVTSGTSYTRKISKFTGTNPEFKPVMPT